MLKASYLLLLFGGLFMVGGCSKPSCEGDCVIDMSANTVSSHTATAPEATCGSTAQGWQPSPQWRTSTCPPSRPWAKTCSS